MTANDLVFPVLHIYRGSLSPARSLELLTTTTSVALRKGFFDGLTIVDSLGKEAVVQQAKKLHGVGPFWGFNVFLNRTIRVELSLQETGRILGVEEVRALVLREFQVWHGWESRGDFDELKASVENAQSVAEIIRLVSA